jgi:hypothetical protein
MANDVNEQALATINDAWTKGWPKVVARAWVDEAFRQRLLANPAEAVAEFGLPLLHGTQLKVVEGKSDAPSMVLSLPNKPADLEEESMKLLSLSHARAQDCMATSCCC